MFEKKRNSNAHHGTEGHGKRKKQHRLGHPGLVGRFGSGNYRNIAGHHRSRYGGVLHTAEQSFIKGLVGLQVPFQHVETNEAVLHIDHLAFGSVVFLLQQCFGLQRGLVVSLHAGFQALDLFVELIADFPGRGSSDFAVRKFGGRTPDSILCPGPGAR